MTCEIGYDNLFHLCDFAANQTASSAHSSGTVTVNAAAGTVKLEYRAGSASTAVYTHYAYTNRSDAGMYDFPVESGKGYTVSWTLKRGNGNSNVRVYAVFFGNDGAYKARGNTGVIPVENVNGSWTVATPEGTGWMALFFNAVCDEGQYVTFSDIRVCPAEQERGNVTYMPPGKMYEYSAASHDAYGPLLVPERTGYAFGGWFTGVNGTGRRITRYSEQEGHSTTVYAKWVSPFQFGRNESCFPVKEAPFTPICSRPAIGGSTPLNLNIPVPSYAPPIPPEDCVCFSFSPSGPIGSIDVADCSGKTPKAQFSLSITPASNDCCTGAYKITPELNVTVPCIPFNIENGEAGAKPINMHNRSKKSENGMDGSVDVLKLIKPAGKCCDVQPVIDITFPDCKKGYNPEMIPNDQITFCTRDPDNPKSTKQVTKTFIRMFQDTENCSLYPQVIPFEIPCCNLPDLDPEPVTINLGQGCTISYKLKRTNCIPELVVTNTTPINLGNINIPEFCLADTDCTVAINYIDKDGNAKSVTSDNPNANKLKLVAGTCNQQGPTYGCKQYTPQLTLDLGELDVGPGISNGGNVYQDDGGNLHTDGRYEANSTVWYGGGLGDLPSDSPRSVESRGPNMRGYNGFSADNRYVPFATNVKPSLLNAAGTISTKGWASSRPEDGTTTPDTTDGTGIFKYGVLDMILPSGIQWHKKGLALTLSEFVWAESGLLSTVSEIQTNAALVAPAPEFYYSDANLSVNGVSLNDRNASGLAMRHLTPVDGNNQPTDNGAYISQGLSVNDGNGLRIFGRDIKTISDEITSNTDSRIGQLEVYAHDGDFTFTQTNKKLVLNDKMAYTNDDPPGIDEDFALSPNGDMGAGWVKLYPTFAREKDYTLPIVLAHGVGGDTWSEIGAGAEGVNIGGSSAPRVNALETIVAGDDPYYGAFFANHNGNYADVNYAALTDVLQSIFDILATFRQTYLHIAKSGVIIGVDGNKSAGGIIRHADGT